MSDQSNSGRTAATLLADIKDELKQFVQTRLEMFNAEVREKLKTWKVAAPIAAGAVLLLTSAYLLFTMSLVGLVLAFLPNNPYRWCLAFLAIAVLWSILGGIAGYFAKREFALTGWMPKKTIEILKGDKVWIQSEVHNHI